MKTSKIIGSNIKRIREQKGMKQEILAKEIGITKGRMSQIESGECGELSLNRIEKIARALKVDFFDIIIADTKIAQDYDTIYSGFSSTHYNVSPDLIKALADELINRISK